MTPIHDAIPGLTVVEGHAFEALVESIARHTVAVVPGDGKSLGSGVCVSYKGQAFLATAAHVIGRRPLTDIGVLSKAPAPLNMLPRGELRASIGRTPQGHRCFPLFDRAVVADDDRDIALLHFVEVPSELSETYFSDLTTSAPGQPMDPVIVLGFPGEIVQTTHRPGNRASHLFTHVEPTRIATQDVSVKGFNSRFHMALEFSMTGTSQEELRRPHGLSGSGVWPKPPATSDTAVWDPRNVRLAGIQIAWLEKQGLLIATRVEQLRELLDR